MRRTGPTPIVFAQQASDPLPPSRQLVRCVAMIRAFVVFAWINAGQSLIGVLGASGLLIASLIRRAATPSAVLLILFALVVLLLSLAFSVFVALGVGRRKPWARGLSRLVCCLSLIGNGISAIWLGLSWVFAEYLPYIEWYFAWAAICSAISAYYVWLFGSYEAESYFSHGNLSEVDQSLESLGESVGRGFESLVWCFVVACITLFAMGIAFAVGQKYFNN